MALVSLHTLIDLNVEVDADTISFTTAMPRVDSDKIIWQLNYNIYN
jgi:hypothetical protein